MDSTVARLGGLPELEGAYADVRSVSPKLANFIKDRSTFGTCGMSLGWREEMGQLFDQRREQLFLENADGSELPFVTTLKVVREMLPRLKADIRVLHQTSFSKGLTHKLLVCMCQYLAILKGPDMLVYGISSLLDPCDGQRAIDALGKTSECVSDDILVMVADFGCRACAMIFWAFRMFLLTLLQSHAWLTPIFLHTPEAEVEDLSQIGNKKLRLSKKDRSRQRRGVDMGESSEALSLQTVTDRLRKIKLK